jgi:hypothetical protein
MMYIALKRDEKIGQLIEIQLYVGFPLQAADSSTSFGTSGRLRLHFGLPID